MKENRKGAYLHHDKVSCISTKQSVLGGLFIQDVLKMFYKELLTKNELLMSHFTFFFLYQKTGI